MDDVADEVIEQMKDTMTTVNEPIDIFSKAESYLKMKIPQSIKNLLIINGYVDASVIAKIDENIILEIENFARTDLIHIIDADEYVKYYGPFARNPERFKFVSGYRQIIKMLSEYFQDEETRVVDQNLCQKGKAKINLSKGNIRSDPQGSSLNLTAENAKILEVLKKWAKTKSSESEWELLSINFNNISVNTKASTNGLYCIVTCFCGSNYKLPKVSRKGNLGSNTLCNTSTSYRWIYSNFHTHLLEKHINSNSNKKHNTGKNETILSFLNSNQSAKLGGKVNIIQNIRIPVKMSSASSQDGSNVQPSTSNGNSESTNECTNFRNSFKPFDVLQTKNQKWRTMRYQRTERLRRARETSNPNQSLLTDYFLLVDKICNSLTPNLADVMISKSAVDSNETLTEIYNKTTKETSEETFEDKTQRLSVFLRKLLNNAVENFKHTENNNSFDEFTKKISVYLFYTAGRLAYETLHSNLKSSLPSISTLNRYIENKSLKSEEGDFDFQGLSEFLERRGLPKFVWISEDGTRVSGKIEYDSITNKVVGFVLPLKDGLPVQNTFIASSSATIQQYFKTGTKASYAYVIVAQPLSPGTPSYCLSLFGTVNKFTHKDVVQRWNYLKMQASKFGITIVGFSSDGDPRVLKAMRLASGLGNLSDIPESLNQGLNIPSTSYIASWKWYHMNIDATNDCFFQDFVHILTKLRVRFLNYNITLIIGDKIATPKHLTEIINTISKDQHLLTLTDLKGEDKMNFLSAEKMCSTRVMELLKHIPNTEGTILYLKIMNYIISAFLDNNTSLSERVYKIWFVVFFLRVWRSWIKHDKNHTLEKNFLSYNGYVCIELNAHTLIKIILLFKFKHIDTINGRVSSDMLNLINMSSQPCEKLFRTARSMTSTYSTMINFSIKDLLYRIGRIHTINNIIIDIKDEFLFPREEKKMV